VAARPGGARGMLTNGLEVKSYQSAHLMNSSSTPRVGPPQATVENLGLPGLSGEVPHGVLGDDRVTWALAFADGTSLDCDMVIVATVSGPTATGRPGRSPWNGPSSSTTRCEPWTTPDVYALECAQTVTGVRARGPPVEQAKVSPTTSPTPTRPALPRFQTPQAQVMGWSWR